MLVAFITRKASQCVPESCCAVSHRLRPGCDQYEASDMMSLILGDPSSNGHSLILVAVSFVNTLLRMIWMRLDLVTVHFDIYQSPNHKSFATNVE